jgi:hypothetical protein
VANAFVILEHSGLGPTHCDLMLQDGPALATWQLPVSPVQIGQGQEIPATKLPAHRAAYLEYEGPVSGGRGQVRRVDGGTFELLEQREELWRVRLRGEHLDAEFELVRQTGDLWQLRRP